MSAQESIAAAIREAHAVDESNPTWVMCSPEEIAATVVAVPEVARALAAEADYEQIRAANLELLGMQSVGATVEEMRARYGLAEPSEEEVAETRRQALEHRALLRRALARDAAIEAGPEMPIDLNRDVDESLEVAAYWLAVAHNGLLAALRAITGEPE